MVQTPKLWKCHFSTFISSPILVEWEAVIPGYIVCYISGVYLRNNTGNKTEGAHAGVGDIAQQQTIQVIAEPEGIEATGKPSSFLIGRGDDRDGG